MFSNSCSRDVGKRPITSSYTRLITFPCVSSLACHLKLNNLLAVAHAHPVSLLVKSIETSFSPVKLTANPTTTDDRQRTPANKNEASRACLPSRKASRYPSKP